MKRIPNVTDGYVIFILFKLGLRLGEVVALKFSDVDFDAMEIHIHRMEAKYVDEHNVIRNKVVNYTKQKSISGDRFLPISQYEIDLFSKVKKINLDNGYSDQGFIFCDEKGRTPSSTIDYYIRRIDRLAGIPIKSAHDIRRTVASEMFNKGIPIEIVRDYLGHSDVKTTFGYIYDNMGKKKTNEMIIESLEELSGYQGTQRYSKSLDNKKDVNPYLSRSYV